jgi:N-acetylglucosamine-6-phosphate deacetylase
MIDCELLAGAMGDYHLEGPWLCAELGYRGAHPAHYMHAAAYAEFER